MNLATFALVCVILIIVFIFSVCTSKNKRRVLGIWCGAIVVLLISMLISMMLSAPSACSFRKINKTVFTVTNVDVQRIKIGDAQCDKIYYLITYHLAFSETKEKISRGSTEVPAFSKEAVKDVVLNDSANNRILGTNCGTPLFSQFYYPKDSCDIHIQHSDEIISDQLVKTFNKDQYQYENKGYFVFYVKEGTELPASLTIQFEKRTLKVKVNNTPINCGKAQ